MPVCFDSKKAQKNARKHAAARAKVFPSLASNGSLGPMYGKTWAVADCEKKVTASWGLGNEEGSVRIALASETPAVVTENAWKANSLTTWTDGVQIGAEGKVPDWVDTTPLKSEEQLLKERVDNALVGWPWKGLPLTLVSIAPYTFNENVKFSLPTVTQMSDLFTKLFVNAIILEEVTHNLFQHHDAAWKFSATCKEAWRIMRWNIDTWDMTGGDFHSCEKPRFGKDTSTDPFEQGSVAPIVMVTPVRQAESSISYLAQIQNLNRLCVSISNFADYFRNLQLHRIPFLTTEILALLIPKMRNLQILGVYNCQLIHVGETMKLLDIVKTDRPLERENQVALDFYPNYHLGPVEEPGNPYSVGSYGVTWDNWNFDSCRALWCLLIRIIPKARSQGIDFESRHTMFRQWMEKGPCHKVEETISTFMNPESPLELIAAMINYRRTQGKIERLKQCNRPNGIHWAIQSYRCTACREKLMGIFFSYTHIHEWESDISPYLCCGGCLLNDHLRFETDHYKQEKRRIIRMWLSRPNGLNSDNLSKALVDFYDRDIEHLTQQLEDRRLAKSKTGPDLYDREIDERQKPLTKGELSGRTTTYERSPEVNEKLPDNGHDYYRQERYDGHRLGH